jgi:hypothetical protein
VAGQLAAPISGDRTSLNIDAKLFQLGEADSTRSPEMVCAVRPNWIPVLADQARYHPTFAAEVA